MKVQAEVGTNLITVELARDGRLCRAVIDGREHSVEVSQPEPNVYLIKDGNSIHEASVNALTDGAFTVQIHGREHLITIIDPRRLRGGGAAAGDASGKAEIKTAMPGKVVRLMVAEGDSVQKGDGVIVVEAMKMQNEMKAPKDGIISEIRTAEGLNVGAGDILVVIE